MKYKNILLDLDNTLYDTRASEQRAIGEFLAKYAPQEKGDKLLSLYRQINQSAWQKVETGEISTNYVNEYRFMKFFEAAGMGYDPLPASQHYLNLLVKHHLFLPGAEDIYEYLMQRYRVVLITNGIKKAQEKRIQNTFLDKQLSPMYTSEDLGVSKPDPLVIEQICSLHKWHSSRTIIIGDSLSSDIQCAQNAGIASIWCNFTGANVLDYKPDHIVYTLSEIKEIL